MNFYKETNKHLVCENLSDKEFEVLQRIDKLFIIHNVSRNGKYVYIKFNRDTHYCEEYELVNLIIKKTQRKRRLQLNNPVENFIGWEGHEEEYLVFYVDDNGYKICRYIPKHIDSYIIDDIEINDKELELHLSRYHYEKTKRIKKELRLCTFNIEEPCCYNISNLHTTDIKFIDL